MNKNNKAKNKTKIEWQQSKEYKRLSEKRDARVKKINLHLNDCMFSYEEMDF
jgi:hypothetical protein